MSTRWQIVKNGQILAQGDVLAVKMTRTRADSIAATVAANTAALLGVDPSCCSIRRGNGSVQQKIVKRARPLRGDITWRPL